MSAHADDLRYFYAEDLGSTIELVATAGAPVPLRDEALEPGRYALRIVDFAGATAVWVRQGANGEVTAAPAAPSTRFTGHTDVPALNLPLMVFMVRQGGSGANPKTARNQLSVFAVGGAAVIQVTKISRDKS